MNGKRSDPLRIGVLSAVLGDSYAGPLLAGAVAAAAEQGVQVIGIQTVDLSVGDIDAEPPRYELRAAWRRVAGLVVVVNAVDPEYLQALRAAGKPVVLVSNEVKGFSCPVVMAGNRSGVDPSRLPPDRARPPEDRLRRLPLPTRHSGAPGRLPGGAAGSRHRP